MSSTRWLLLPDGAGAGVTGQDDQDEHHHREDGQQYDERLLEDGHPGHAVAAPGVPGDVAERPEPDQGDDGERQDDGEIRRGTLQVVLLLAAVLVVNVDGDSAEA